MKPKLKQELYEFYENFYNTAPVGFYSTDLKDGWFIRANPLCVNILGLDNYDQLMDCRSTDYYVNESDRVDFINKMRIEGSVSDFEALFKLPNGEQRWVSLSGRLCKSGDCIEGSIADITHRKYLEAELKKYQEKHVEKLTKIRRAARRRIKKS